jgi:RNA polymerase sigma factor (TIGR02999 family)
MGERGDLTELLSRMHGDDQAALQALPLVYRELRRIAAGMMRHERPGHTLQPTAVVHEAYMRLVAGAHPTAENRAHFFALAARAMRQVLVDHARRKLAAKRGGELQIREELEDGIAITTQQSEEVLAIHEALEQLQALDDRQARIVEMHYFGGDSVDDITAVLGISERTVKRELQSARLFLKKQLEAKGMVLP